MLRSQLLALRPQLAAAAQAVYDEWDQSEDDPLNGGGICQDIAEAIASVIDREIPGVACTTVSATIGEQHVWAIVFDGVEGYSVDIPCFIYETGGGYSWTKIEGVEFIVSDLTIERMNPADAQAALEDN